MSSIAEIRLRKLVDEREKMIEQVGLWQRCGSSCFSCLNLVSMGTLFFKPEAKKQVPHSKKMIHLEQTTYNRGAHCFSAWELLLK